MERRPRQRIFIKILLFWVTISMSVKHVCLRSVIYYALSGRMDYATFPIIVILSWRPQGGKDHYKQHIGQICRIKDVSLVHKRPAECGVILCRPFGIRFKILN